MTSKMLNINSDNTFNWRICCSFTQSILPYKL